MADIIYVAASIIHVMGGCVNSRHPGPRCEWAWELQLLRDKLREAALSAAAAAVGPGGGDRLGWGHVRILYKAPKD